MKSPSNINTHFLLALAAIALTACGGGSDNPSDIVTPQGSETSPPKSIALTNLTPDSVTVSWSESSQIDSYTLFVSTSSDIDPDQFSQANRRQFDEIHSPFRVSTLDHGVQYYFAMMAEKDGDFSDLSNIISLTTPGETTVAATKIPDAPRNLQISASSTSTLDLQWSASSGAIQYNIYVGNSADVGPQNHSPSHSQVTSATSIQLNNLQPNTQYFISVTAENGKGFSGLSNVASTSTQTLPVVAQPPVSPTSVGSANVSHDQFTVSWASVTSASNYQVYLSHPGSLSGEQTYSTAQSSYTFTGLEAFTEYLVQIQAQNGSGSSPRSNALSVYTDTAPATVGAYPTGKLNDTGVAFAATFSGQGTNGNVAGCTGENSSFQDCNHGRDKTDGSIEDGWKGFSYSKVSKEGYLLPASATQWACVKDNVTGLLWEVKQTDGGLNDKGHRYSWYDPNRYGGTGAGVRVGQNTHCSINGKINSTGATMSCNTHDYAQAVRDSKLCGSDNWQLPDVYDLQSIVSYNRGGFTGNYEAIDYNYFPNFKQGYMWTSTEQVNYDNFYLIDAQSGLLNYSSGGFGEQVRLVTRFQY